MPSFAKVCVENRAGRGGRLDLCRAGIKRVRSLHHDRVNLRLPRVVYRPLKSRHLRDIDLSCLYRRDDSSPILSAFLSVVRQFPAKHTPK